jgi:hypothetical protein
MPVSLLRNPPPDASAGFMSLRYLRSGTMQKIQHVHLNTVSPSSVATEFTALAAILKEFYSSDWKIQLTALTQRVGSTLERVVVPIDPTTGEFYYADGVSTTTPNDVEGFLQTILTFNTVNKSKAPIRLVGVTGGQVLVDSEVDANASGFPAEKLCNYLVNTSTHIVAHDGSKYVQPCHMTIAFDSQVRRQSMRVA